mmetsp:Transcript_14002/g.32557  ORF Transcript_14002/g.32557 Transcript_14002/m.32557 type:complete len:333 (+) Transcript_14002:343-1341(+)
MHHHIEADELVLELDAHPHHLVQHFEDDVGHDHTPPDRDRDPVDLDEQAPARIPVEDAVDPHAVAVEPRDALFREKRHQNPAQDPAGGVDAERVERVIEVKTVLQLGREVHHWPSNQPSAESPSDVHVARTRRDRHQPRNGARNHPKDRGAVPQRPLGEHPRERGGCRRHVRVEHRHRRAGRRAARRPPVEAAPPDPEERCPEHRDEHVVRRKLLRAVPGALADDDGRHEAREARGDVHHVAPREVEHPRLVEKAVGHPRGVRDGAVDQEVPQRYEDQHRPEPHAVRECARDERRRDDRERQLVQAVDWLRHERVERVAGLERQPRQPEPLV